MKDSLEKTGRETERDGTIVINEADGDRVVIKDRAGDDVTVEVSVRQDGHGREAVKIEIVDIEDCGRKNCEPPPAKAYKVKIDGRPYVFEERYVTGKQLLERAGKTPVTRYELEKRMHGGAYVAVGLKDRVDLGERGIEVFETFPLDETEG